MINTKSEIAVSSSPSVVSPAITLTLENTGIFLGILVSTSVLAGIAITFISKMNRISNSITQIEKSLEEQARNTEKISDIDRTLALHIQPTFRTLNCHREKLRG